MIINENNKSSILNGKFKRGFNQTPKELKEKLHNDLRNYQSEIKPKEEVKMRRMEPQAIKKAMENLRKLN